MELSRDKIKEIINDDWLLMDDCEGNKNCDVVKEMARIALASLEAEPVGFIARHKETGKFGSYLHPKADWFKNDDYEVLSAYTAPPAPVSVPDAIEPTVEAIKRILPTSNPDGYAACIGADMWNACRAAMLQGADGNSPVIPDGWVAVPVEPTIAILDEFDSIIDYGAEDSKDAWSRLLAAAWIKSLPAAPQQEVESQIRKGKTVAREEWELGARLTKHRFKP